MKHLWYLVVSIFFQMTMASALTVTDVKISVTANSAAAARDQALIKAHTLAFQKLIKEYFPESSAPSPPEDVLIDMVTNFSIDREKTTPQSYAASLTFQFDESRVQSWLRQDSTSFELSTLSSTEEENSIKITANYSTLADWQHIQKTLDRLPGVEKVKIISLSPHHANLELTYTGEIFQFQQRLNEKDLILIPHDQNWEISTNTSFSHTQSLY